MTEIHDRVLTADEVQILLDWYHQQDELVDDRRDIRSKSPKWTAVGWPQYLVKKVLDRVLPEAYRVELIWFAGSRISLPLHVDSGDADDNIPYKNVIIPLYAEGPASTVIFDNHWPGAHTRFGKTRLSPFVYNLPDRMGQMRQVDDIRKLLVQCQTDPASVEHFVVDRDFVELLERLVRVRSGELDRPPDGSVSDYSQISNYQPDAKFDPEIHTQHLDHVPIESLHGLTIEQIAHWQPGQAIVYDRSQLHAAGSGHTLKIGISVFTYRY